MKQAITIPELPESVADAVLASWAKPVGAAVKKEELLLELETDKVVLEVSAQSDGVLSEILVKADTTVIAGQTVGYIDIDTDTQATQTTKTNSDDDQAEDTSGLSPSVRRMLAEHNLNADTIPASGTKGRLLKSDIEAYLQQQAQATSTEEASPALPSPTISQATSIQDTTPSTKPNTRSTNTFYSSGRDERRVPMSRIRNRIAERLLQSQQNTATLTTFNEVNLQEVIKLRRKYKERFLKVHGVKLGFMSFFIKAATEALKRYPQVNASIDGHDIVYHGYYDIGVAVSTERGLVVPILRDTDFMGLADIEKQIGDYAQRAKDGRLDVDELRGGTFTVSNGGIFGSLLSTPILNPPQSAILGMHTIQERPIALNGEVVIRPMMYLALSYDHRLIDGKTAVKFLLEIKELLEEPASMLLEL